MEILTKNIKYETDHYCNCHSCHNTALLLATTAHAKYMSRFKNLQERIINILTLPKLNRLSCLRFAFRIFIKDAYKSELIIMLQPIY